MRQAPLILNIVFSSLYTGSEVTRPSGSGWKSLVLVTFLVPVTKYSIQSNLKEKGVILTLE